MKQDEISFLYDSAALGIHHFGSQAIGIANKAV